LSLAFLIVNSKSELNEVEASSFMIHIYLPLF